MFHFAVILHMEKAPSKSNDESSYNNKNMLPFEILILKTRKYHWEIFQFPGILSIMSKRGMYIVYQNHIFIP